jgi:hypothetical protein
MFAFFVALRHFDQFSLVLSVSSASLRIALSCVFTGDYSASKARKGRSKPTDMSGGGLRVRGETLSPSEQSVKQCVQRANMTHSFQDRWAEV